MATTRSLTHDPPAPNGGVRSTAYFKDDSGQPADESVATQVEIVEWDEDGREVFRTYADIER